MKELYKIILVDDEDDIRGRISSMITNDTGFEVIASASNGYDALELIEEHNPHAVITDIRMPYINGIALAEEIKTEFPKIKVAFLTGFGEFDYARKAVELGIVSYLMKPVIKLDVLDYLKKIKTVLDEEYNLVHNTSLLQTNFLKNKQMFIEIQFNEFLRLGELSDEDINNLRLYDLHLENNTFIVGIIEFYNAGKKEQLNSETFLREYMQTALAQYDLVIPFYTLYGFSFIIINEDLHLSEIEISMEKLRSNKVDYDKINMRIALSSIFDDMKAFPKKTQEALMVLESARFTNRGNILTFDSVKETTTNQVILSLKNINEIENIVRFGSEKDIESVFDKYKAFAKEHSMNKTNHQLFIISTANIIMNYAFSIGIEFNHHFEKSFFNELLNLPNVEDILEYTKIQIIRLRKSKVNETNTKLIEVTDQVISYIELNYKDNSMSLSKISDHFHVSVSYLSSLLKKEKGISFNKYLIQVRIDKAKELLRYSDLKVVEVAKQVGYSDVYYFSHSFKKNTKVSPKEYRAIKYF